MAEDPRGQYEAVVSELEAYAATASKMFGMPCIKIGGKAFAGYLDGAMVFKLQGDDHAHALALDGAHLFDPTGQGRAMKEWVVVPAKHADVWLELGQQALQYVAGRR